MPVICQKSQNNAGLLAQARLPEIEQLTKQLSASAEELSDVRFQLEEDKATASAAQVQSRHIARSSIADN